jgi:hypothetical protein
MIDAAARIDKWTDYYERNRNDGGPIQALFDTNAKSLARKAEGNLNDVGRLTNFITGSSYGNMVLVPGRPGTMQLVHHGFACNTREGFTLAFAHENLGDCTAFKTIQRREDLVAPVAGRADNEEEGEERTRSAPTLDSMLGAESANEFAGLEGEGNDILDRLPNHCFITPDTFIKTEGSKKSRPRTWRSTSSRSSRARSKRTTKSASRRRRKQRVWKESWPCYGYLRTECSRKSKWTMYQRTR